MVAALIHFHQTHHEPNSLRIVLLTALSGNDSHFGEFGGGDAARFALSCNGNFAVAWHHPLIVETFPNLSSHRRHPSLFKWLFLASKMTGGSITKHWLKENPTWAERTGNHSDLDWLCWLSPHVAVATHDRDWLLALISDAENRPGRDVSEIQLILSSDTAHHSVLEGSAQPFVVTDFVAIRNTPWSLNLCEKIWYHPLALGGADDTVVLSAIRGADDSKASRLDNFLHLTYLILKSDSMPDEGIIDSRNLSSSVAEIQSSPFEAPPLLAAMRPEDGNVDFGLDLLTGLCNGSLATGPSDAGQIMRASISTMEGHTELLGEDLEHERSVPLDRGIDIPESAAEDVWL
jgi:hypothetical protein